MPSYLYAVQDTQGREIVSAHVDVEKVSDVTVKDNSEFVYLMFEDVEIVGAPYDGRGPLTLYRWPSDDKHSTPVKHPV